MKTTFCFQVSVAVDNHTGRTMAVYLQLRKGKSHRVKEYAEGSVFADYDRSGELLGIELLAPCDTAILSRIAKSASAKRFVQDHTPRDMLVPA